MQDLFFVRMKAVRLRQQGRPYAEIRRLTGMSFSLLSYWFRHIKISDEALRIIKERKLQANARAREVARRVNLGRMGVLKK